MGQSFTKNKKVSRRSSAATSIPTSASGTSSQITFEDINKKSEQILDEYKMRLKIVANTITFALNDDELSDGQLAVLEQQAREIKKIRRLSAASEMRV